MLKKRDYRKHRIVSSRKPVLSSIDKDDLMVHILDIESDDERSPSVYDNFEIDYYYPIRDFKEICADLSETQSGYYETSEVTGLETKASYKTEFYTIEDEDYLTGTVYFELVTHYSPELAEYIDEL